MNEIKVMNAIATLEEQLDQAILSEPGHQEVRANGGWTAELRAKHGKLWKLMSALKQVNQLCDDMQKMM